MNIFFLLICNNNDNNNMQTNYLFEPLDAFRN